MFKNVAELVQQANESNKKIYEVMLEQESELTGTTQEEVFLRMKNQYYVMKRAAARGMEGVVSHSGMTGGDAKRIKEYIDSGIYLTDKTILNAACYAVSINEVNASMGIICATPTAGSSGVLPAVVLAVSERLGLNDDEAVKHL